MWIKKITIENFRGYQGSTTIEFNELNVFIGKNDIGKSTILEALDIFFNDGKGAIKADKDDYSKTSNSNEFSISVVFSDYPKEIDIDAGNSTTLENEYLLNNDKLLEIKKTYRGATPKASTFIKANHPTCSLGKELLLKKNSELKQIVIDNDWTCDDKKINAKLRKTIWDNCGSLQREETEIPIDKEDAKKISEKLFSYFPLYTLFQSDRANTDGDDEVQNPMKLAVKEILQNQDLQKTLNGVATKVNKKTEEIAQQTLNKLREMNPNIANKLKPVLPDSTKLKWADVFKGIKISSDENIPLNKRGSGVKRLILLNFFRAEAERKAEEKNKNKVIYAIEEPETSQHPEHQDLLIKAFIKLSKSSQIILTTHSPSIVKTLPEKSYFLVTRDENNNLSVKKATDILSKNALPYISANEINFLVFNLISEEFHTEIYSRIELKSVKEKENYDEKYKEFFDDTINNHCHDCQNNNKEDECCKHGYKKYFNENSNKTEYISLHKYIRHQIHHPENDKNKRFTEEQLKESIEKMRKFLKGGQK